MGSSEVLTPRHPSQDANQSLDKPQRFCKRSPSQPNTPPTATFRSRDAGCSESPGQTNRALDFAQIRCETTRFNRDFSAETAPDHVQAGAKTVTLVISNCSKRKRFPLDLSLRARDLSPGSTQAVAVQWTHRLKAAPLAGRAGDLYGGRAFVEARRAAGDAKAGLAIVSAGLGLVDGDTEVPAYSLTTATRDPDGVLSKTSGTATAWWTALQSISPFQSQALATETGLILAALSAPYVALIAEEWARWPAERQARLRLFSKERPDYLSPGLAAAWMPYDDRLDAAGVGLAGTQSDFAQRAVRHFASTIRGSASAATDADAVRTALEGLSARVTPTRARVSDEALKRAIDGHWNTVEGRSGAMLRHLRDDLRMACEQSRFQSLFKAVAEQRRTVSA